MVPFWTSRATVAPVFRCIVSEKRRYAALPLANWKTPCSLPSSSPAKSVRYARSAGSKPCARAGDAARATRSIEKPTSAFLSMLSDLTDRPLHLHNARLSEDVNRIKPFIEALKTELLAHSQRGAASCGGISTCCQVLYRCGICL